MITGQPAELPASRRFGPPDEEGILSPPIRYMGTKRSLAPFVGGIIRDTCPRSRRIADLFAGIGSITTTMAPSHSVAFNDTQLFTGPLARARFKNSARCNPASIARRLRKAFDRRANELKGHFRSRLEAEAEALSRGSKALACFIESARHVGNSPEYQELARQASCETSSEHYALAVLYFASSYFSTRQAIEIDALRFAIDKVQEHRDWLVAAWLAAAAAVINSPGHTAQFLRPTKASSFARLCRQWRRPIWEEFLVKLNLMNLAGTENWRDGNSVHNVEAINVLASEGLDDVGLIYADPPYTKDQYSRFYHVYETLCLYDFPSSRGKGRYRGGRFRSDFCLAGRVHGAFCALLGAVAESKRFLVLSYPSDGLLQRTGHDLREVLGEFFHIRRQEKFCWKHSTLGGARGVRYVDATEQIFACAPR